MTDQHPITPSPELLDKWLAEWAANDEVTGPQVEYVATRAARWGADQELEACCEYLTRCAAWEPEDVQEMLDLRRPKPPSLKEQALKLLNDYGVPFYRYTAEQTETIRRALEQLDD